MVRLHDTTRNEQSYFITVTKTAVKGKGGQAYSTVTQGSGIGSLENELN